MNLDPQCERLLRSLSRGGEWQYGWSSQDKRTYWSQVGKPFYVPADQHDFYFGVHPTRMRRGDHERARIIDIAAANCLFADLDAKNVGGDKAHLLAHIKNFSIPASLIVDSGGGFHGYWILGEPFIITNDADRQYLIELQVGWVPMVGGDDGAKDIARVLRLPGTYNCKPQYAPNFPRVTFVRAEFECTYAMKDLEREIAKSKSFTRPVPSLAGHELKPYVAAALHSEIGTLITTTEGNRNNQLNKSAYLLGQFVGSGELGRDDTEKVLFSAAQSIGLGEREIRDTIRHGIEAGMCEPRTVPRNGNGHHPARKQQPTESQNQVANLEKQIAELVTLPAAQRGEGLRTLFATLTQFDDFDIGPLRALVAEKLGMRRREFDEYLKAARKDKVHVPLNSDRYKIEDSRLCSIAFDHEGSPRMVPLCNFVARIVAEEERDDGCTVTRRFAIEGQSDQGMFLPQVFVDTTEFENVARWAVKGWGSRAVVRAGPATRDKLREAIQIHSLQSGIQTRRVYTHTGWRTIANQRVYLTANGALGMDGIRVELEEPSWRRYALPVQILDPVDAMRQSLDFLRVADPTVTVPLWYAMWLAPVVEIVRPNHMLHLYGASGNLKSTVAAVALSHYGTFEHDTLPASWLDTANEIEKALFIIKDAPIVIDDFAPQQQGRRAQEIEDNAQRIIRAVGNHAGRRRLNRDLSVRAAYEPRGIVISTGEQLPSGTSIMARLLVVEVAREQIDIVRLSEAQEQAKRYPHAIAGYLMWLAQEWDRLANELPNHFREIRKAHLNKGHARLPGIFALHHIGLELGLQYGVHIGALTPTESDEWLHLGDDALRMLIDKHSHRVVGEHPTLHFLNVLGELLTQKVIFIGDVREPQTETPPGRELMGWEDEEFYYLLPSATYHKVAAYAKTEGGFFPVKPNTLYRDLQAEGYLVPIRGEHTGIQRVAGGEAKRVMKLAKNKLREVWGIPSEKV